MDQQSLFVLLILVAVPAFYFLAEHRTQWRLFYYLPPLLWIYVTPVVLRLGGALPEESVVYTGIRTYVLPLFITVLVMTIDLATVVRALGRALPVLLLSTLFVIITAPIGYLAASPWLPPEAWLGFGALAGSWIGGTANMAAVGEALGTPPDQMGWAIVADQSLGLIYIPLMIASARYAGKFNAWAGAQPVALHEGPEQPGQGRKEQASSAADQPGSGDAEPSEDVQNVWPPMLDFLLMAAASIANVAFCAWLADRLPEFPPVISRSTWLVLLVTTGAVLLSFTPIRRSEQAKVVGTALLYIFVANMGASASLAGLTQAPAFVFGAFIWLAVATALMFVAARLMRTDLTLAVLAANANIGGVASNPVVAAAHDKNLVPIAIMMALLCYTYGNYGAILTGHLVRLVAGA